MSQMLLDLQNRGQLAAGFTSYQPDRTAILKTYKDVGTVSEAMRLSHTGKHDSILSDNVPEYKYTQASSCYCLPTARYFGRKVRPTCSNITHRQKRRR